MAGAQFEVLMEATGSKGPARSEEESAASLAADVDAVAAKRARIAELRAGFEADGATPERAEVQAATAYAGEQ